MVAASAAEGWSLCYMASRWACVCAQVLANLAALDSDKFYADSFSDGTQKVGALLIDHDRPPP